MVLRDLDLGVQPHNTQGVGHLHFVEVGERLAIALVRDHVHGHVVNAHAHILGWADNGLTI